MVNPNKYIRQAIIQALSPRAAYYKRVPKTIDPGNDYIVISAQTKRQRDKTRCGYEWSCIVTVNIYLTSVVGMPPTTTLDDVEEDVHNKLRVLEVTGGFTTKMVNLVEQLDLEERAKDMDIDRRVLMYELWLNNIES